MSVQELIDFLRLQIHIQDRNKNIVTSEECLDLTDNDIKLFLNIARSKHFSEYSLYNLPESAIYPIILLAKRELFTSLAVKSAPEYDITADNNNVLREHQMFQAYLALIKVVDEQYEQYLESISGLGVLSSADVLLNKKYYSQRNYDKSTPPMVTVRINTISKNHVAVSWTSQNINRFLKYEVRVGNTPTWNGFSFDANAKIVADIKDIHVTMCQVQNLKANTPYYLSVAVYERNGLFGVLEVDFTTEVDHET